MAEPYTMSGWTEHLAAVDRLPQEAQARLRKLALSTAIRVMARAKTNLAVKTHGTGATADAIYTEDDPANRVVRVVSPGAPHPRFSVHRMKRSGRIHTQRVTQNNQPIWLEYGTVKMSARPYMGPAAAAEEPRYREEAAAIGLDALRDTLGGG